MWFLHFRHGQHAVNMNRCTNAELEDIHFLYRLANGYGRVNVRLYGERYSTRKQPNDQTFARVHQNLAEHGSFGATIDDTLVNSEMDLVARISIAAATIRESPVFSNIYVNPCHVGIVRACMPMAEISNISCEAFMSYFYFIMFSFL
ncbi:hypothetical protein TNCV_3355911 [Trichonephila clavipes]|nr:hypothetical protein TNCV_3355911 [Trichonephila clavipes]